MTKNNMFGFKIFINKAGIAMQVREKNIGLLQNRNVSFKSDVYSAFANSLSFANYNNPNQSVLSLSNKTSPKKQHSYKNITKFLVFIIASSTLFFGAKKILTKPTKKDLQLTILLEEKLIDVNKITEKFRLDVKKIYETNLEKLKNIFHISNEIKAFSIESDIAKIKNSITINDLFIAEDKTISNIYRWFKESFNQQKLPKDLLKQVEDLKKVLMEDIEKLKVKSSNEIAKTVDIPKNLNTNRSRKIIQRFNEESINPYKEKMERIKDYVDSLFRVDASSLNSEYTATYSKLVTFKNDYLNKVLDLVSDIKNRILLKTKSEGNFLVNIENNSFIPESIKNNPFVLFVNSNKRKEKLPIEWVNFVKNNMGKELSFKDLEIIEKRIKIRSEVVKSNENILQDISIMKDIFIKFFKTNIATENHNLKMDSISTEQAFELITKANWLKEAYGVESISQLISEIKQGHYVNFESTIFKALQKENDLLNKKHNTLLTEINRLNKFFEWEEILN